MEGGCSTPFMHFCKSKMTSSEPPTKEKLQEMFQCWHELQDKTEFRELAAADKKRWFLQLDEWWRRAEKIFGP